MRAIARERERGREREPPTQRALKKRRTVVGGLSPQGGPVLIPMWAGNSEAGPSQMFFLAEESTHYMYMNALWRESGEIGPPRDLERWPRD